MDIKSIKKAAGLKAEDAELIGKMCEVYTAKRSGNMKRNRYYDDKTKAKNLGLSVPKEFQNMEVAVGWCAKGVDMLASRSQIDTFSMEDDGAANALMREIMTANDIIDEYDKAKTVELIHSCGFWTIDAPENAGEPPAILYHDAESGAALWDYRFRRPKCGIVVYDSETSKNGKVEPTLMHAYFTDHNVILTKVGDKSWSAEYKANSMGRPMFEAMSYRPSYKRPFGKSVISKTAMAITDEAQREMVRTAIHAEIFSAPQRYLLGVSEEALSKSKISLYMDAIMMATRDENGELPVVGQFAQASLEPHMTYIEQLASRMAAECKLPPAALGVASHTFTSSDAMSASENELCIEAESINRNNGKALKTVMQMALCVAQGKGMDKLTDAEKSIQVSFKNPAMPSISSQADAMVKIASVADGFAATPTFFEQIGFTEPIRRRLTSEMRQNFARQQIEITEE